MLWCADFVAETEAASPQTSSVTGRDGWNAKSAALSLIFVKPYIWWMRIGNIREVGLSLDNGTNLTRDIHIEVR